MATHDDSPADHHAAQSNSLAQKIVKFITSRYLISVGAQGLMSALHLGVNLLLIQLITPYAFGIYAFAFVLAMFASAINNALISTPLTVYTPVIKNDVERNQQEDMFSTLNVLLSGSLILAGIIVGLFSDIDTTITLAVTMFVAAYAARQYSRSFGYARFKPLVAASGDITYVVSGVSFIALVLFMRDENTLDISIASRALMALASANLVAMFVERWQLHGTGKKWLTLADLRTYSAVWLQSRWALIGALTTLFASQAHGLIVTSTYGPTAFAPLAAGMVLFGPVRIALLTWQNMVKPEIALALSENKGEAVKKQIRKSIVLMGAAVVALGLCLLVAWPYLSELMYSRKYADQPMGYIVSMWFAITLFAALYNAPSAALQAMRDFRILANASIYAAIISGVLVSLILYFYNPASTLLGILAAECFMAVFLTRVMLNHLKKDWQ